MLTAEHFKAHRQALFNAMPNASACIVPAAPHYLRNGDAEYAYRQSSDFYYLTGLNESNALAIFIKNPQPQFILFNQPRDKQKELWTGKLLGQQAAKLQLGADEAFDIKQLNNELSDLLIGLDQLYIPLGRDPQFDNLINHALNALQQKIRSGINAPQTLIHSDSLIHPLRLIKTDAEIALMKKAGEITVNAHCRAMQACPQLEYEYQLEAIIQHEFMHHGARVSAYQNIVASGSNACVLHYTDNADAIDKNALVLIDAGCEYQHYAADVTRTFPANGRFSKAQREIYDIVLHAQQQACQAIKSGISWDTMQAVIVPIISQGLKDLGVLHGDLNDIIDNKLYQEFYMHKSGHWLGMDVHDVGHYKINNEWVALQSNQVLTVEPGIYISADNKNIPEQYRGIGIRIEDDVVVTDQGHINLTEAAPKDPAAIEKLMAG